MVQELAKDLAQNDRQILEDMRAILEAHHERRAEIRRELHAIFSQFGQFPQANNVRHLRVVK